MSAYLVSDATITKILDGFHGQSPLIWDRGRMHNKPPAAFDKLGQDLLEMNHRALLARYDDPMPESVDYEYPQTWGKTTPVQVYKAIRCLAYQCSEGNVPDCALFKRLMSWDADVASHIISTMPEYQQTPWDFPDHAIKANAS